MNKIDYYKMSEEEIVKIKESGIKPKLLLHACCGPCACYPIEYLKDVFNITIIYNNSNIYPIEEFNRRKQELINYVNDLNLQRENKINIVEVPYTNEEYMKNLEPYKDLPERSLRCHLCYKLRIEEAFVYAINHGFDYVCTVMTISRQKDSQVINSIAKELNDKYPSIKYFYSDFKKKDGTLKGNTIAEKHHMYRQDYCGCKYSYDKRNAK